MKKIIDEKDLEMVSGGGGQYVTAGIDLEKYYSKSDIANAVQSAHKYKQEGKSLLEFQLIMKANDHSRLYDYYDPELKYYIYLINYAWEIASL